MFVDYFHNFIIPLFLCSMMDHARNDIIYTTLLKAIHITELVIYVVCTTGTFKITSHTRYVTSSLSSSDGPHQDLQRLVCRTYGTP